MRAVLIGLGGIGKNLAEPLARVMVHSRSSKAAKHLVLVDGDSYEEKNKERQRFSAYANKAQESKDMLGSLFPELKIEAKSHYIDPKNIFLFIKEGDAVFLAVDNHATRKLVSDHVKTLNDCLLISGGNEETDGNIQVYWRSKGKEMTPPLTWQHPEIEFPKDKNPADVACGEMIAQGATQLLAVNLTIASLMLNAYTMWLEKSRFVYGEAYFDLLTGNVRAVKLREQTA